MPTSLPVRPHNLIPRETDPAADPRLLPIHCAALVRLPRMEGGRRFRPTARGDARRGREQCV